MAYIGFNDRGYEYFNEGYYLLFSEDHSHELLFHYVVQDLSCLPGLFDQYISRRMDTSTFKLYDCPGDDTSIDQIKRVLMDAHPYYRHEVREVLIRAIGSYFNDLLLYSFYHQDVAIPGFSETWYLKRVTALLSPLLELGDTYPMDFYNEYLERTGGNAYTAGESDEEVEIVIPGVPQEMPTGFSNEIQTQNEIYNMLYFLLDIAAPGLDALTTPQRIWLYGNIMSSSGVGVTVPKKFFFRRPTLYRAGQDYSQAVERNQELNDKFSPLYALSKLNVGRDGIPADMKETFCSAIEYARTITVDKPHEEYRINSLRQLLYLEVWSMIQNKVKIRKCRHCGKYFVAATRRIVYCDRVDESGIRCSAVGYHEAFQKKMEDDEPLQIYNRAYKTHHARVRKGTMSKENFQLWCIEAKERMERARAGELDIAQFQEWLKK